MNSICQPQRKMQVLVSNLRFPQHLCQTLLCLTAFTDPSGLTMSKRSDKVFFLEGKTIYLTIIPRARMGSESIAHEAEGRMGY